MKTFVTAACFLIGFFVLLIAAAVLPFLIRGGAFDTAESISPGVCSKVDIPLGSAEDIQIDHLNGMALMSVIDRRGIVEGKPVKGTILALDLQNPNSSPSTALASEPEDFRPHGLSLFESEDGVHTLFVINHAKSEERIEIFEKNPEQGLFVHKRTLSSPLLFEPNDLVAVGPQKFYVASDSGATNRFEQVAEMLFAVGLSALVYYDGANFEIVEDNLRSSGGINVSRSLGKLYVGETIGESIRVYKLDNTGTLAHFEQTIELEGAVDNIDVDKNDNIWIANHTDTLALIRHFGNALSYAPTQIQRIQFADETNLKVETVYENDGSEISAGSVGAYHEGELIMGSITDRKVLRCQIDRR